MSNESPREKTSLDTIHESFVELEKPKNVARPEIGSPITLEGHDYIVSHYQPQTGEAVVYAVAHAENADPKKGELPKIVEKRVARDEFEKIQEKKGGFDLRVQEEGDLLLLKSALASIQDAYSPKTLIAAIENLGMDIPGSEGAFYKPGLIADTLDRFFKGEEGILPPRALNIRHIAEKVKIKSEKEAANRARAEQLRSDLKKAA